MTADLRAQLPFTLETTDFASLGERYAGKVRDVYDLGDRLLIVATDRVSAFDRVIGTIPFKGEILTRMALDGFTATEDLVEHHVIESPDPNVIVGHKCTPFPVEFVMRAYVTGSLWRDLGTGAAAAYEVEFPTDLKKDQRLPHPVLTPSTKASIGEHDQPTSRRAILASGAMSQDQFDRAETATRALFARGQAIAAERGLILVDTKYELGLDREGRLRVIDEIHTPDSSRFWVAETYEQLYAESRPQKMLDKENLRTWLMDERGFSGQGEPPELDDEIRVMLADKYLRAFRTLSGRGFEGEVGPVAERIRSNLERGGYLRG